MGTMNKIISMFRSTLYNKGGQFALPSVLLVPIVLLVIYLIFETTKLSREKIRQQFALDSAAFVELAPAATFLNATAYVNGAFPYRIFYDNMRDIEYTRNDQRANPNNLPSSMTMFDWFYASGAFPGNRDNPDSYWQPEEGEEEWNLQYAQGAGRDNWMVEQPTVDTSTQFVITNKEYADVYDAGYEVVGQAAWLYSLVYTLFGDIFDKQNDIYEKLTQEGMFFRKSYYLNTGTCRESECGKEGSYAFKNTVLTLKPFTISKMKFNFTHFRAFGNEEYHAGASEYPYELKASDFNESGKDTLFQFAYVDSSSRRRLSALKTGMVVTQHFTPPSNYFDVNLTKYDPHVRVKVSLQCPAKNNNCIWPKATPKYQVRLTP